MLTDENQAAQDQDVISVLRRIAQAPDDCRIRASVPKGGDTANVDGLTSSVNFPFALRLLNEIRIDIAVRQRREKIWRFSLRSLACQAVTAPVAAHGDMSESVEWPGYIPGKPPWVLIHHQSDHWHSVLSWAFAFFLGELEQHVVH